MYTQTTYGRLSRMLAKRNIKSVALPPRNIFSYFPPIMDALGLRTLGIYSIPCERGSVYIGQSVRSIQLRIKEHNRHIRLAKLDKSRVAEHSNNHDHIIKLQDTSNTDEPTRYNNDLLIYKINSTCFGQYFAHHQERKTEIFIAYGILLLWWVGRR